MKIKTENDYAPFDRFLIKIANEPIRTERIKLGADYLALRAFKKASKNHKNLTRAEMKEDKENLYNKYCQVLFNNIEAETDKHFKLILEFVNAGDEPEPITFEIEKQWRVSVRLSLLRRHIHYKYHKDDWYYRVLENEDKELEERKKTMQEQEKTNELMRKQNQEKEAEKLKKAKEKYGHLFTYTNL
jgi:hypothetical protein